MLGDLDLIHMARDVKAAPASAGAPSLTRLSLDSTLSNASTASNASSAPGAGLSSSWGGFGGSASPKGSFLLRQFSAGATAPMAIPGRGGSGASAPPSGRPSADFGAPANAPSFRRNSIAGYFPASVSEVAEAGPAPPPAGAHAAARMPALVRSLSKGLSQSLDFR